MDGSLTQTMDAPLTLVSNKSAKPAADAQRDSLFTSLPPDEFFDSLTRRALEICKMPFSIVVHVDERNSWIVSSSGLENVERPDACTDICAAALAQEDLQEVSDLSLDHHFYDNALVNRAPYLRYFNGLPLHVQGKSLGMLAIFDDQTGGLSYSQRHEFIRLGRIANHLIESYRQPLPTKRFEIGAIIDRDTYVLDADSLDVEYQCHCSTG
ncbi:MAG: GAF domain-containing protein, partial [Pseudomonadota bacterium]